MQIDQAMRTRDFQRFAYLLTTYPCASETFIAQEIAILERIGVDVHILAATDGRKNSLPQQVSKLIYRSSLRSPRTWLHTLRFFLVPSRQGLRLLGAVLTLLAEAPRDAIILLRNLHAVAAFSDYVERHKICHIIAGFMSWPAVIAYAVSRTTGISFSINAHARDIFIEAGAVRAKVKSASMVTVCTQQGLDGLKSFLPPKLHTKLHVVPHGLTAERWQPVPNKTRKTEETCTFMAIGRFVPKKGFAYLLRAFAKVILRWPQCRLCLIGEGPQRAELVQLATTLGIANSIEFTGWLPREYLPDAYDDATALVVPSVIDSEGDRDGLPNVILEAFACRVPVIASDLAGIKEAVWHEITGLLVAAGDEDKLADAMLRLLGDSTLGRQLADNARRMLNEKYDADENVRRALSLLSATISAEDTAGRFTCC